MIEFKSQPERDTALKMIRDGEFKLRDGDGKPCENVKIDRARLQSQKTRNAALHKAHELVKAECFRTGNKSSVKKSTTMPTRQILVGTTPVFIQEKDVLRGYFKGSFSHLIFPW